MIWLLLIVALIILILISVSMFSMLKLSKITDQRAGYDDEIVRDIQLFNRKDN